MPDDSNADDKVKKVIVAVHGIGDQFRYETIQAVAAQFCLYFDQPPAITLGRFHSALFSDDQTTPADLRGVKDTVRGLWQALADKGTAAAPPAPSPGPAALVLTADPGPKLPGLAFAEVYWADVPRRPARDEHTLEETKK